MKNLIKTTVLLLLFVAASASTQFVQAKAAVQSPQTNKIVTNLQVTSIGTTIYVSWNGGLNQGPWHVEVYDLSNNNVLVYSNWTFNNFDTVPGMTTGHTYLVNVSDNTTGQNKIITI